MIVACPCKADNPVVFANDAFLRMTGYSSAQVLGRDCRSMRGPETDAEAIDAIRRASASDRSSPPNC
jgi:PAS domain S-box-containing protein